MMSIFTECNLNIFCKHMHLCQNYIFNVAMMYFQIVVLLFLPKVWRTNTPPCLEYADCYWCLC